MNLSIHRDCLSTRARLSINAHVSTAQFVGPLPDAACAHDCFGSDEIATSPQEITSSPPVEA